MSGIVRFRFLPGCIKQCWEGPLAMSLVNNFRSVKSFQVGIGEMKRPIEIEDWIPPFNYMKYPIGKKKGHMIKEFLPYGEDSKGKTITAGSTCCYFKKLNCDPLRGYVAPTALGDDDFVFCIVVLYRLIDTSSLRSVRPKKGQTSPKQNKFCQNNWIHNYPSGPPDSTSLSKSKPLINT